MAGRGDAADWDKKRGEAVELGPGASREVREENGSR